ncbi:hypothetical protein [Nocardioides sp.]|uniref:hypothetical protein n=1 Tax=Nocardioides sp. TaxID=35761 RepID=UPI0035155C5A
MTRGPLPAQSVDPFDLPEALGVHEVVWEADDALGCGPLVRGRLVCAATGQDDLACDLLAVDVAYPEPVVVEEVRRAVHEEWRLGQVRLLRREDRLTLGLPGTAHGPESTLVAVERFARALGARPTSYAVLLRLGR